MCVYCCAGGQRFGSRVHPKRRAAVSHQIGIGRRSELSKLHIKRYPENFVRMYTGFFFFFIATVRARRTFLLFEISLDTSAREVHEVLRKLIFRYSSRIS